VERVTSDAASHPRISQAPGDGRHTGAAAASPDGAAPDHHAPVADGHDGQDPPHAHTVELDGQAVAGHMVGGRYRLVARIGAGGMASIYQARDLTLERDVAVKMLHAHLADEPPVLARFRTEAQHAAALAHPHVVSVFDQGGDDQPFIVMEHVDGPSLRELLRDRGRVSPPEALALLDPACRALHRAHSLSMVHRDIKPENVLITGDGVVKVADFGIARAMEGSSHTQTGALVGSVHYLAPELVDDQRASAASDQYAVGMLLFELLTGRKALPAESPVTVALRHAREPVPPPSQFASDVPAELDEVVKRACALDPSDRYPDLAALLSALHAAVPEGPAPVAIPGDDQQGATLVAPVEDTPVPATSPTGATPVPSARRGRRRGRGPRGLRFTVAVTAVLLLGLVAGSVAAWHWLIAPVQQMPQLVDTTETAAREQLDALGLIPSIDRQNMLTSPEGTVIGQDPPAGNEVRRGSEVGLIVSAGPSTVEMIDVTGMSLAEARSRLQAAPLHLSIARVDRVYSDTVGEGDVIAQSVRGGEDIEQGSDVVLQVSRGVQQVEVPDVSGMTRSEAEQALADAGLTLDVSREYSDTVPSAGEVIEQSVEPGAKLDIDSSVEVVVSAGPRTIDLPNVRGDALQSAVNQLRELDLRVQVIREPRQRIGPFVRGEEGLVEETAPPPGSSIQRQERVKLYTFDDDAEE
jgi:serine/threonine-protein kinase